MTSAAEIASVLRSYRWGWDSEQQLQTAIRDVLSMRGYTVAAEQTVAPGCRIDLLVDRVGIEVKIEGSPATVSRQLRRYLASPMLDELVLVTAKSRHLFLHPDLENVEVVTLGGRGL